MTASKWRHRNSGFTLLEVLISIAIFAIVISSVYGAYKATFQTVGGTERQVTLAAAARVILERISDDLASLTIGDNGYLRGSRGDINGLRADSFSCISAAHIVFHRLGKAGGQAVLTYSVEETESGLFNLYRSDVPYVPDIQDEEQTEKGELLGRGLSEFRVSYVTADGSEVDNWSSGLEGSEDEGEGGEAVMSIPVLIRLQISFAESPDSDEYTVFRTAVALPQIPDNNSEG